MSDVLRWLLMGLGVIFLIAGLLEVATVEIGGPSDALLWVICGMVFINAAERRLGR